MRCAEHLAIPGIKSGMLVPLLSQFQGAGETAIHAVVLPEQQRLTRVRAFIDSFVDVFRSPLRSTVRCVLPGHWS